MTDPKREAVALKLRQKLDGFYPPDTRPDLPVTLHLTYAELEILALGSAGGEAEQIAKAAKLALGEWLAWPDAARDGPVEVDAAKVLSWLSGLPSKLAALSTPKPTTDAEITYGERLEYETRILAIEMDAVALTRALTPFSAKADKWEANHPGQRNSDSVQIQHRLGDFRSAREALAKHAINSGERQ